MADFIEWSSTIAQEGLKGYLVRPSARSGNNGDKNPAALPNIQVFENSRQTKHPDPDWRLPEEMLHKARG